VQTSSVSELLAGLDARLIAGDEVAVSGVAYRSDQVRAGDVFFCVPGFAHDGHEFAADAVSRGAVALVVNRELPEINAAQYLVGDVRVALAMASARVNAEPAKSVRVAGITGTNGKTTTTYMLDAIAREAGHRTGIIGTVETKIGDESVVAGRTTPESADLQALLGRMRDDGVAVCSMEVSSHAIDLKRVHGIEFAVVAFTNLTQDHLDYHHTLEEYYSVKRRLFTEHVTGARVVNIDDELGAELAQCCDGVLTVGQGTEARLRAVDVSLRADGATFALLFDGQRSVVELPFAGSYNVSNALVAAGCALCLGIDLETVARGLANSPQVPGRLERIQCGQPFQVVVDYAHTPDSLEKATTAICAVTPGRTIVVFGCGGDRDPEKRPLMGAAAARCADHVFVTSDNPRSEDPAAIILQIEDGLRATSTPYDVEVDRRRAIEAAINMAGPGDAVLIAGKGHEDYQIFADRTVHFDDREVAREVLQGRC